MQRMVGSPAEARVGRWVAHPPKSPCLRGAHPCTTLSPSPSGWARWAARGGPPSTAGRSTWACLAFGLAGGTFGGAQIAEGLPTAALKRLVAVVLMLSGGAILAKVVLNAV
jgi:hypothetical protein